MSNLIPADNPPVQKKGAEFQTSSNYSANNSANNKRIAKNTLFLYFRSALILFAGLYTSREVLAQLGVSDFGVYNVVAGVIILFSFIQEAMNSATTRFFTFNLGKGNFHQLRKTFSLCINIHILTAVIILILGETVGLWFLNTQLNIPAERMGAANFVFHFSVLSACIGILQAPYMAVINAHERMKVYAYFGIADAVFKLTIALSLSFAPVDKLKIYSFLLFCVYFVMFIAYRIYCRKNFKETHFKWFWDKKMFLQILGFSGWSMLSGISSVIGSYGVIMLLNMFHGVMANAAYGIMALVSTAVSQLSANLVTAFNPQVIKSYASGNIEYLHSLIFRFSRYSFLLLMMVIFPVVLNMDFLLNLWLKEVPDFAVAFCQIRSVNFLVEYTLSVLFAFAILATGKIKHFTIVSSICAVMNFVLCYLFFKHGYSPIVVPIVYITIGFVNIIVRDIFVKQLINFPVKKFYKKVLTCQITIVFITLPLPILLYFNINSPIISFFVTSSVFLILFLPSAYFFGLENSEKILLRNKIRRSPLKSSEQQPPDHQLQ